MVIEGYEAGLLDEGIALGRLEVFLCHLFHKITEAPARLPAEFALRSARIPQQRLHLGRAVAARIDRNN